MADGQDVLHSEERFEPLYEYLVVRTDALPVVYNNVMEVKELLQSGKFSSVNDAVKQVGISRSAFYKYRDAVSAWQDPGQVEAVTIALSVRNDTNALASIILQLTESGAKLLNIAQGLTRHGIFDLMLSVNLSEASMDLLSLRRALGRIPGVRRVELWSAEDDLV